MARRGPGRREFLTGIAAGVSLAFATRAVRGLARADTQAVAVPPRYWLQIVPAGGIDAVWTTDPRTKRTVAAGVDVPYAGSKIVDAGQIRLGPALADLRSHADRLSILNGVLVKAANHYTGMEQITRLRTGTTPRTPSCLDIVGAHRDSQAVGHVIVNSFLREARTLDAIVDPEAGCFGGDPAAASPDGILGLIDTLSPEELADLSSVMTAQIESLQRRGDLDERERSVLDSLGQSRQLFDSVARAPRFEPTSWLPAELARADGLLGLSRHLQRALWLIENDLTAVVSVFTGTLFWDSHANNDRMQLSFGKVLALCAARLVDELERRSNRHGKLSEQTGLLVASEIGRFPYMNQMNGKDHFPQVPFMFGGPPFRRGRQFGAVGKEMESLPSSLATGAADPRGSRVLLDDVGHTVLRAAGIAPLAYGVVGQELAFLRAG